MMHPAKKGIHLVHCLAYIYFVLKDVVSHRFESLPLQQKLQMF